MINKGKIGPNFTKQENYDENLLNGVTSVKIEKWKIELKFTLIEIIWLCQMKTIEFFLKTRHSSPFWSGDF